ncbi:MAG: serine/threonine-protein kinase [Terriglobales bacterium]
MAMMFGRFEIQSEISTSETSVIYKALDCKANQVVALKTQDLEPLGSQAKSFVRSLIAEGEQSRELAGQNIAALYGAGEIEGKFCASMEYVQGNSIATMLARKEGFSIWDLLDLSRQVCVALGAADKLGVAHSSLEPAKIMVQWDGLVKVLGYGISTMSLIRAETGNGLGPLMPYCSPEQIRGEAIDQRSNLFTLGAILYEMVAGQKAFGAEDPVVLLGQIENQMPAAPESVNRKVNRAVSAVVMKALAKDPAARYQTARALMDDLEKCKEKDKIEKTSPAPKKASSSTPINFDPAERAAAAAKFTTNIAAIEPAGKPSRVPASSPPLGARAAAASAGGWSSAGGAPAHSSFEATFHLPATSVRERSEEGDSFSGAEQDSSYGMREPVQRGAALDEKPHTTPQIAVDPLMAGDAPGLPASTLSGPDQLPPLNEAFFAPLPFPEESPASVRQIYPKPQPKEEPTTKIQPRQMAKKALSEVATIPPRLILYSILAAAAVILIIAGALYFHVRLEDDSSTAAPHPIKAGSNEENIAAPPAVHAAPQTTTHLAINAAPHEKRRAKIQPASAPVSVAAVIPGEAFVDSTPQGAAFQVDGKNDPSWITPFGLTALTPGTHILSIAKSGYTNEIRSVEIASGARSAIVFHLAPVNAILVVNSAPPGAAITVDGRPTGRVTPAQFSVEKGTHTIALTKTGFLDETTSTELAPAQNFQYSAVLRPLGNADELRMGGKFSKIFGGESTAGMGAVNIHTQPKGAQVAINQRVLDKLSPVGVMLGPGNYVVDITLTGFKPVHKIVTVEKGGKIAIDETLERN